MASGIWGGSAAGERGFELTPPIYVALSTAGRASASFRTSTTWNDDVPALRARPRSSSARAGKQICDESEGRSRALEGIAARFGARSPRNRSPRSRDSRKHMARNATDPQMAERLGIVASEADRLTDGRRLPLLLPRIRRASPRADAPLRGWRTSFGPARGEGAGEAGVHASDVTGNADLEPNADRHKLRQVLPQPRTERHPGIGARAVRPAVEVRVRAAAAGHDQRDRSRASGMSPEVVERIKRPYYTTRGGRHGLGVVVARARSSSNTAGVLTYQTRAPAEGTAAIIRSARSTSRDREGPQAAGPSRDPMVPLRVPTAEPHPDPWLASSPSMTTPQFDSRCKPWLHRRPVFAVEAVDGGRVGAHRLRNRAARTSSSTDPRDARSRRA